MVHHRDKRRVLAALFMAPVFGFLAIRAIRLSLEFPEHERSQCPPLCTIRPPSGLIIRCVHDIGCRLTHWPQDSLYRELL